MTWILVIMLYGGPHDRLSHTHHIEFNSEFNCLDARDRIYPKIKYSKPKMWCIPKG